MERLTGSRTRTSWRPLPRSLRRWTRPTWNVSATTTILATFSRAVDPLTVDDSTIYLHAKNDATHVAVVYGFTDNNRKVSLTPTATLDYTTSYEVEFLAGASGVKDAMISIQRLLSIQPRHTS